MNHYVAPVTLSERLLHVAEAKRKLGTRIPWLCDSMDNDLKHAMGDRPNSEFLIDPEGRIVVSRDWSNPARLREDLAEYVGPSATVTAEAALHMSPVPPAHAAPTGIVPRLAWPTGMPVLRAQPVQDAAGEPFYVKLRAEAEPDVLRTGQGRIYLGLMLDPLYHVHWNNEAMPVTVEIVATSGFACAPGFMTAVPVNAPMDADPREFLVEICSYLMDKTPTETPQLTVRLRYFACDDLQTFCKPVTQSYVVYLERDRDGGARRAPADLMRRQPGRDMGAGRTPARNRGNSEGPTVLPNDPRSRSMPPARQFSPNGSAPDRSGRRRLID